MAQIARVVAVGASNLTRGFHAVLDASRTAWGRDVQVLAALGHGRSYGATSRVLVRTLPGILDCGLWRTLATLPPVPTRAIVTDVGNDILYGCSAGQILAWVEETVARLLCITPDITLTGLPLASVRGLSRAKYLAFRSVLFPHCRLPLSHVLEAVTTIDAGLAALARTRGIRLLTMDPGWYGFDPIHIRRSCWKAAWETILQTPVTVPSGRNSVLEGLRLALMAPERRSILGIEQHVPQTGVALHGGGRVWLY